VSSTRWGEQMRSRGFESYRNDGIRYRAIELTTGERTRIDAANAAKATS
jgi:hypothetical protein